MKTTTFALLLVLLSSALAEPPMPTVPERVFEPIRYKVGDVTMNSILFRPAIVEDKTPAILVFPEWWGLNDYARQRAKMLSDLGYIAMAVDMYGEAKSSDAVENASTWSGALKDDTETWRNRALAAFDQLKLQEGVDTERIGAIGYCFGGTTALQLAYANPKGLAGVVSFHGHLPPPAEEDQVNASILVAHGAADAFVPDEQIATWKKTMEQREIDYVFVAYAGAVHSFTNPGADAHGIDGVGYDKKADRRSWAHMRTFFGELFQRDVAITQPRVELPGKAEQPKHLIINVTEDDAIVIAGKQVAIADLQDVVSAHLSGGDGREEAVIIRADRKARAGVVVQVIDEAKLAGATNVSLATPER